MNHALINVAILQLQSTDNVTHNLLRIEHLVRQAVEQGAAWIFLPENAACFASKVAYDAAVVRKFFAQLAKELAVYIHAGSMALPAENGKHFASSLVYSPQGEELAQYNKIHLFDAKVEDARGRYQESANYQHGEQIVCLQTAAMNLGLAICYDVRFPELFQQLRSQGAQVIALPSAFTYVTGKKHWQILLQARAIETQCYVIAANQGGIRHTFGHSMIVSPDGKILAQASMGEAVIMAKLDLTAQNIVRDAMPWRLMQKYQ